LSCCPPAALVAGAVPTELRAALGTNHIRATDREREDESRLAAA
jgi:hypothetical protein